MQADRLCQGLVRRGYRMAVVCDALGQPVTAGALRETRAPNDNLPRTFADLCKIPVGEHRRRYKNEPAFRARADELDPPQAVNR